MLSEVVYYFRLMRPKQWAKNVFVFMPVLFSFQIFHSSQLIRVFVAFLALCFASSAVYAFNDALDSESDRRHPRKKYRPVAAGNISPLQAELFSFSLLACAIFLASFLSLHLIIIVSLFILLNALYSIILKKVPYLDICCIAIGFVLRLMAGSAAVGVKTSYFLFATVFFLSLFMAAGKRGQELQEVSDSARHVLGLYNFKVIKLIGVVSMVLCCALYSAWVYATYTRGLFPLANFLTIPLVAAGFFTYWRELNLGPYGDPTEILYSSRPLRIVLLAYSAMMVIIILNY